MAGCWEESGAGTEALGVPWQIKIAAKLALARLPGGARPWHRAGLFRHGAMTRPDYALKVLRGHLARAGLGPGDLAGAVGLELGPGDSLASALILRCFGAAGCLLVDADDYASRDLAGYRALAGLLRREGFEPPPLDDLESADALLRRCGARYLTRGLDSLRGLPDASVDFMWSQAVLEHVRRHQFLETLRELCRILKPGGVASHRVDLGDHLGGALNNLRFSERLWESQTFAGSGFYTNRIQLSEMLGLFERAGFAVELLDCRRWERLPTPVSRLAPPFRALPERELAVKGFDVLLRRRRAEAAA